MVIATRLSLPRGVVLLRAALARRPYRPKAYRHREEPPTHDAICRKSYIDRALRDSAKIVIMYVLLGDEGLEPPTSAV